MKYKIEVIQNIDEYRKYTTEWDAFINENFPGCFTRMSQWLIAWWLTYGHNAKVLIYVIREVCSNQIIGLVPLILWRHIFSGFPVRLLENLGRGTGSDEPLIINGHIDCLRQVFADISKRARWDVIKFSRVSSKSMESLHNVFVSQAYRYQHHVTPNYLINLEGTFDSYIKRRSKNFRKNINKYNNRISKQGAVHFKRYTAFDDTKEVRKFVKQIAETSWQFKKGTSHNNRHGSCSFMDCIFRLWEKHNFGQEIFILLLEKKPIAFLFGVKTEHSFNMIDIAFDPAYSQLSPGRLIHLYMIKSMYLEPKVKLRGSDKGGGGPEKTILLSAKRHDKNAFFILVTYLRNPKDKVFQIANKAREMGISNFVEILDRRMLDLKCIFELNHLLKKYQIQIVHVHDQKTTLLGVLMKMLNSKIKIMHTAHGWIVIYRKDRIKQRIQFLLLKCYPLHIAVSKATRDILVKNGIPTQKTKLLYNAIDVDYWQRNGIKSTLREEFNIGSDNYVIDTVGRLSEEKDLPTFLQVAKNILEVYPNSYFVIVGDGEKSTVNTLKNIVKDLGLEKSVIFTGRRTDLRNVYSAFDIFLTTSLTEGLPNTVLEAMAMEVPVVATRVGGVPELVINDDTGFLCEPGNRKAIADKVISLLSDEAKRRNLAKIARKRIVKKMCFSYRLKQIENYYIAQLRNHR